MKKTTNRKTKESPSFLGWQFARSFVIVRKPRVSVESDAHASHEVKRWISNSRCVVNTTVRATLRSRDLKGESRGESRAE